MRQLLILLGLIRDGEGPSLIDDLRTGRAGIVPRLCLSVVFAAALGALPMFVFGLIETSGRWVREEHIALGMCIMGAIWCVSMILVWGTYRRWQRIIKTTFAIFGIWVVTIPFCVMLVELVDRADYFIAGVLLLAAAVSILLIITATYRSRGGKALRTADGTVRVNCGQCGYSLIGLETCRCPECGWTFTLDELVDAQDYAALRGGATQIDKSREIAPDDSRKRPMTATSGQ